VFPEQLSQRLLHQAQEEGLPLEVVLLLPIASEEWGQRLVALVRCRDGWIESEGWASVQASMGSHQNGCLLNNPSNGIPAPSLNPHQQESGSGGVGSAGWSRENEFLGAEFETVLSETEISNKKLAAGLLGVFFGSFGVHKFVLGYKNAGIIMLVVSLAGGVVTCGIATGVMSVIGMIEGIIYLTKSTDEFREMYLDQQKGWF
jgi:TM2 domain-containing membrane protein YozV